MTLIQAVAILNRYRFLWCDRWKIQGDIVVGCGPLEVLTAFLAIAVALAYEAGFRPPPAAPIIEGVALLPPHQGPVTTTTTGEKSVLTYSVQVTPDPTVATYQLTYTTTPTGTTTPGPATTVPLAAGVTCNPLDAVVLTVIGVGIDGASSPPSAAFDFTAASGPLVPPVIVPAAPVVTGVTQTS